MQDPNEALAVRLAVLERRLAALDATSKLTWPHGETHGEDGEDQPDIPTQNNGVQLVRHPKTNFSTGLDAASNPTENRYDVTLADHDHTGDPGDGGVIVVDPGSRARHVPLYMYDVTNGISVPVSDVHGSLGAEPHYHLPDGSTTTLKMIGGIYLPADYEAAGAININWMYSCSTNTGNVRWTTLFHEYTPDAGDTAPTVVDSNTTDLAVPGTANSTSKYARTLSSNPTAGTMFFVTISREGGHANDTCSGQVSVFGGWFVYQADM
jgi:hypothetical protein